MFFYVLDVLVLQQFKSRSKGKQFTKSITKILPDAALKHFSVLIDLHEYIYTSSVLAEY